MARILIPMLGTLRLRPCLSAPIDERPELIAIDLLLDSRTEGSWAVLSVKGDVDIYTAPRLRERIIQLADEGSRRIVVDLQGVEFMDSTGLSVLVAGLKRLKENDGVLALAVTREPVLRILSITGLDRVFPIYGEVSAATASA
jgi:anti-sigma B factor antagonist